MSGRGAESARAVCLAADYPRLTVDPDGQHACAGCGAPAKTSGEPTNGGSYFYVCSRSGASLGYSGI